MLPAARRGPALPRPYPPLAPPERAARFCELLQRVVRWRAASSRGAPFAAPASEVALRPWDLRHTALLCAQLRAAGAGRQSLRVQQRRALAETYLYSRAMGEPQWTIVGTRKPKRAAHAPLPPLGVPWTMEYAGRTKQGVRERGDWACRVCTCPSNRPHLTQCFVCQASRYDPLRASPQANGTQGNQQQHQQQQKRRRPPPSSKEGGGKDGTKNTAVVVADARGIAHPAPTETVDPARTHVVHRLNKLLDQVQPPRPGTKAALTVADAQAKIRAAQLLSQGGLGDNAPPPIPAGTTGQAASPADTPAPAATPPAQTALPTLTDEQWAKIKEVAGFLPPCWVKSIAAAIDGGQAPPRSASAAPLAGVERPRTPHERRAEATRQLAEADQALARYAASVRVREEADRKARAEALETAEEEIAAIRSSVASIVATMDERIAQWALAHKLRTAELQAAVQLAAERLSAAEAELAQAGDMADVLPPQPSADSGTDDGDADDEDDMHSIAEAGDDDGDTVIRHSIGEASFLIKPFIGPPPLANRRQKT